MTNQGWKAVILVVDDDPSVRVSTSRLLRAHGHVVFEAETAEMAVQRAAEVRPQIILMDLHMADRSGIDVAREIKQVAGLQDVPIIATSATPPDSAALSPLFTSVLQKPYSSAELLALLAAALPR